MKTKFTNVKMNEWKAKIKIGIGTYYNGGIIRAEGADVTIGEYCRISYDVVMLTNYGSQFVNPYFTQYRKPIVVGNNVWIGWGAKIRGGVTIGDFAFVGMGAVVVKDVKPFHIAVGNPAEDKGERSDIKEILQMLSNKLNQTLTDSVQAAKVLKKLRKTHHIFQAHGTIQVAKKDGSGKPYPYPKAGNVK